MACVGLRKEQLRHAIFYSRCGFECYTHYDLTTIYHLLSMGSMTKTDPFMPLCAQFAVAAVLAAAARAFSNAFASSQLFLTHSRRVSVLPGAMDVTQAG